MQAHKASFLIFVILPLLCTVFLSNLRADTPDPIFIRHYFHPVEIQPGEEVTIAWRIDRADHVEIYPDVGGVHPYEGKVEVRPMQTTTYTIRATNGTGTMTNNQTIHVVDAPPFDLDNLQMKIQYIDHWNLRYPYREEETHAAQPNLMDHGRYSLLLRSEFTPEEQIRQIKQNLDVAKRWGASSFLLFAREEIFESLLSYNFGIKGIEHLGKEAGWKANLKRRNYLNEVIDYARNHNLGLYWHTNQFHFEDRVSEIIGDLHPENKLMWEAYEKKIAEFFKLFPEVAGIQITASETELNIDDEDDADRMANVTAKSARPDQRILMRTWQRFGDLQPAEAMFDNVEYDNIYYSMKNTSGDYKWINPYDDYYIGAGDPTRQIIEFDAWREYGGHNVFPFYYGDYWAPRMRKIADKGIREIGIRLNWNSGYFPVVEQKWGNWVNFFVLTGLAEDPYREPDEILMMYVQRYYPENAWDAVFDVYKHSTNFMAEMFYPDNREIGDHSHLPRPGRVRVRMDQIDLDRIDEALKLMLEKIDRIPDGTPMKEDLRRGAITAAIISKGIAMRCGAPKDEQFMLDWYHTDPVSFFEFRGSRIIIEGD